MLNKMRKKMALALMPKAVQQTAVEPGASGLQFLTGSQAPGRGMLALLKAYKTNPALRMVVGKIADHYASVHWRAYVVRGKSGKAKLVRTGQIPDKQTRLKELAKYKRQGQLEEIQEHPLLQLYDEPNPIMSGFAARRLQQIYLDIVGESFSVLSANGMGTPIGLWPMSPAWVRSIPDEKQNRFELSISSASIYIDPDDMLWYRDLDVINPYGRGTGVGESLGDEIDTSEYAAKYIKSFFFNSAKPDLLIGVDGIGQDDARHVQEAFEQKNRGFWNSHKTHWVGSKLDVHELNSKFNETGAVDLKGAIRDEFIQTFGVPPEILGKLENSNRATVREARDILASECLIPRLERARAEEQRSLVPRFDKRVIWQYDDPSPDDKEFRLESMQAAPWAATRGEWRELQGLEHRGDIDDIHEISATLLPTKPDGNVVYDYPPPPAPKSKRLVAKREELTEAQVDNVLAALRPERLTSQLDPEWQAKVEEWGNQTLAELGLQPSFDMLNPLVAQHLSEFSATRIKGLVNDTTREQLRATLIEGVRSGEDARRLGDRVHDVFGVARGYRSERIARTEVIGSSNFATYSAYDQSGIVREKQLVATPDDRVRETHWNANGQVVKLNEYFVIGGYKALYPGDSDLPSEELINCRCTHVAVINKPKDAAQLAAVWKAYERQTLAWERQAKMWLRRGFDLQEQDIIAELKKFGG